MDDFYEIIGAVVGVMILALIPTWLLMLFLGNIGADIGFWGCYPLGLILAVLFPKASV